MFTILVTHKVYEQNLQLGDCEIGINHWKPQVTLRDGLERCEDRFNRERRWASQIDGK